MNRSILKAAFAASLMTAASTALAAQPIGLIDAQALKEISRSHCVLNPHGQQATYGVRPHGEGWMLDTDAQFSDPPSEKQMCDQATGSTYGIVPHAQGWMVDYVRK